MANDKNNKNRKQYSVEEIAKFNLDNNVNFWNSDQVNDYLEQQEAAANAQGTISKGHGVIGQQTNRVGQPSLFGERKNSDSSNRSLATRAFNWFTDATHLTSPPTYTDGYGTVRNANVPLGKSAQGQELDRMGRTAVKAGELGLLGYMLGAFGPGLIASPLLTATTFLGGLAGYGGSKLGDYVGRNWFGGDGYWGSTIGGLGAGFLGAKGANAAFKAVAPARYTGETINNMMFNNADKLPSVSKNPFKTNWWKSANALTNEAGNLLQTIPGITPNQIIGSAQNWLNARSFTQPQSSWQMPDVQTALPEGQQQLALPASPQQLALTGQPAPLQITGKARVAYPFNPTKQGKYDAAIRRDAYKPVERLDYDNHQRYPDYQIRKIGENYVEGEFGPTPVPEYGIIDGNGEIIQGGFDSEDKANVWLWKQDRSQDFWLANRMIKYGENAGTPEQLQQYQDLLDHEYELANEYYNSANTPEEQRDIEEAYNRARLQRELFRKNINGNQGAVARRNALNKYYDKDAEILGALRQQQYDDGLYTSDGLPWRHFWIGDQVNDRAFMLNHLNTAMGLQYNPQLPSSLPGVQQSVVPSVAPIPVNSNAQQNATPIPFNWNDYVLNPSDAQQTPVPMSPPNLALSTPNFADLEKMLAGALGYYQAQNVIQAIQNNQNPFEVLGIQTIYGTDPHSNPLVRQIQSAIVSPTLRSNFQALQDRINNVFGSRGVNLGLQQKIFDDAQQRLQAVEDTVPIFSQDENVWVDENGYAIDPMSLEGGEAFVYDDPTDPENFVMKYQRNIFGPGGFYRLRFRTPEQVQDFARRRIEFINKYPTQLPISLAGIAQYGQNYYPLFRQPRAKDILEKKYTSSGYNYMGQMQNAVHNLAGDWHPGNVGAYEIDGQRGYIGIDNAPNAPEWEDYIQELLNSGQIVKAPEARGIRNRILTSQQP